MTRIEQQTHYHCDGCGAREINPLGWSTVIPLHTSGGVHTLVTGTATPSEDYCNVCMDIMRKSVRGLE